MTNMSFPHDGRGRMLSVMATTHSSANEAVPPARELPAFHIVAPGVELGVLRRHANGGATFLIRMARGAHAPMHDHPGGEETYLVSGKLRIGPQLVMAGEYYYAPPGEVHDGHAEEDTVLFVVAPGGIVPMTPLTAG